MKRSHDHEQAAGPQRCSCGPEQRPVQEVDAQHQVVRLRRRRHPVQVDLARVDGQPAGTCSSALELVTQQAEGGLRDVPDIDDIAQVGEMQAVAPSAAGQVQRPGVPPGWLQTLTECHQPVSQRKS